MSNSVHESADDANGVEPRLLNLHQAAVYLGVSYWSTRDFVLTGRIPTVRMPGLTPREGARRKATLRRVLIDRADLDRFIDALKGVR